MPGNQERKNFFAEKAKLMFVFHSRTDRRLLLNVSYGKAKNISTKESI